MKPAKSSEKSLIQSNKQDELANKFPALAMANSKTSYSNIATYDNDDDDIVNDAMASLESFAPSSLKKPTENPSDSNPISKQEPEKKSNKSSKREREGQFDTETGILPREDDEEEDMEIELVEEEPPFLHGHGRALGDLTSNMRGIGLQNQDLPEWKKHVIGGKKSSF
ncbi:hypothetical protein PV328_012416, partial [Microctonus aethiopoides]